MDKTSVRASFVTRFGEAEARAIESAAEGHTNGIHDRRGSDPFKWAICICIGYQCFEKERFREHHDIKAPASYIDKWIIEEGDLANHDGDVDFIALMINAYDKYIKD